MRLTTSVIVATLLALTIGVFGSACRTANVRQSTAIGQSAQTDLSKVTANFEPVTIRFQDAQFRDVLSFLSKASGVQIGVTPDVALPTDPISINFSNAKFADVFRFLITSANLSYTVVDGNTVLITKKA